MTDAVASGPTNTDRIRLGISSCLLGEKVRFDGQHKLDRFLRDTLGDYVVWVPVCPEVECGLTVPREAMRLVGDPAAPRLLTVRSGVDHTEQMRSWAARRVRELQQEDLAGFVFKSKSPSSGMERVKVYGEGKGAMARPIGVGLFAAAFIDHFPLLPVEEEGRLHDPALRENFIESVFALRRYQLLLAGGRRRGGLVDFHSRHKLQLLAHSPLHYRELGRLVAAAKAHAPAALFAGYQRLFLEALALKTTPAKHVNVMQHMMGYFKKQLSSDEKQELLEVVERYRAGHVPLVVPLTLFSHYVRKYEQGYLAQQTYLNPHPAELRLRNHA